MSVHLGSVCLTLKGTDIHSLPWQGCSSYVVATCTPILHCYKLILIYLILTFLKLMYQIMWSVSLLPLIRVTVSLHKSMFFLGFSFYRRFKLFFPVFINSTMQFYTFSCCRLKVFFFLFSLTLQCKLTLVFSFYCMPSHFCSC